MYSETSQLMDCVCNVNQSEHTRCFSLHTVVVRPFYPYTPVFFSIFFVSRSPHHTTNTLSLQTYQSIRHHRLHFYRARFTRVCSSRLVHRPKLVVPSLQPWRENPREWHCAQTTCTSRRELFQVLEPTGRPP